MDKYFADLKPELSDILDPEYLQIISKGLAGGN